MAITWEAKRRKAIKSLLTVAEKDEEGHGLTELNVALDTLAIAHIAVSLDSVIKSEIASVEDWLRKEERTFNRLIETCRTCDETDEDPEAEERLSIALDEFTLAHVAANFEWANRIYQVVEHLRTAVGAPSNDNEGVSETRSSTLRGSR
jgi:hypothetical protein